MEFSELLGSNGYKTHQNTTKKSGTTYYNCKATYKVVLLAVTCAKYKFIHLHIGIQGRISNGAVFKYTSLYDELLMSS